MFATTEGQGDEEGASLDVRGSPSDFRRGFFTIIDNIFTVGESAGGEEQAAQPLSYPGDLLGAGGGYEK